ncbi:hypothetical protein [Streptomyces sp. UG1]|uniref:hypothetical protein n=1 Tax=Streptomyces sp. UG1 TaxID=3417652 RepID=UPI003CF2E3F6
MALHRRRGQGGVGAVEGVAAFDIAGKGVAEAGGVVETLRQAAEMSSVPAP